MRSEFTLSKAAVLFFLIIIFIAESINVCAQTPQQIAKTAFGSVVLLVMEDANGQSTALGSGFFILKGVIASNLHVVEGASRGYAKIVGQKAKFDIEGIVGIDQRRDLVLLKISAPRTPPLSLGDSDAVQVGESIYAVGNPQGLEGTFSQGIVSSIRQVASDKLLQITAPISPGSSGGPVLNSKGDVIGVSVATFSGGQNLNFAIPANYLKAMLAKVGASKPLASTKSKGNQQSILADLGGRSTEGVIGSQFMWDEGGIFYNGAYSFSLQNKLSKGVKNIYALVIFYDEHDAPIDVDIVKYASRIPPGLAKRVTGKVESSVQRLTPRKGSPVEGSVVFDWSKESFEFKASRVVEIRVLDFQVVD
jgi:S1-C subfamily serine protease